MVATVRSLAEPEALGAYVGAAYGLDVTGCVLVRSLVNDVYRLSTPERPYVLKLYRPAYWSMDEVSWEAELAGHLAADGIAVPTVRPLADGRLGGLLEAPEGGRPFLLFQYIVGVKPEPPFDDSLYRDFGRLVAGLHESAGRFRTTYRRRRGDLQSRLDQPLALVLPLLAAADRTAVQGLAVQARARITEYAAQGLDWGICHGDVTLDNVLLTTDGLTMHDLDLAGEGWRAADLTGVASTNHWDAFVAGYTSRRPLPDVELAAIPWFGIVARIANLRFHLVDKPLLRGTESTKEGWVARDLVALRQAADELT